MSLKVPVSSKEESEVTAVKKTCHVFWDYENCPKPSDRKFEEAYVAIRDTLESINLSMRGLNIYCDEEVMEKGSRQTLNDLGCSVINPSKIIGSTKKKETSDLRIAVDISMYAFDNVCNPDKCAIVLITSDSDFGHLLSQMRSRSFDIVLICAKGVPERLTVHAMRCIRMYDLFVQTEDVSNNAPARWPALQTEDVSNNAPASWPALQTEGVSNNAPASWPALQNLALDHLRDDDNNSIVSLQREQEPLRIDDLIKLVLEMQSKNSQGVVRDSLVGQEFRKRYPVLDRKGGYKNTKSAAISQGKLFSLEISNNTVLLSTNKISKQTEVR